MITVIFQDETGATLASEEISDWSEATVVMVKRNSDGTLTVQSFEPLELNDHPYTLREIGGRVVDFAK